jgi:uncharacterized membrane protein YhaH (DUF805 family)
MVSVPLKLQGRGRLARKGASAVSLSTVNRTFDTQGRIGREEYARSAISMQLGAGVTSIAVVVAAGFAASVLGSPLWIVWAVLAALALVFGIFTTASLTLAVRRLHDLGASGWWLALGYGAGFAAVPLLFMGIAMHFSIGVPAGLALGLCGSALSWALLSARGQPAANRYGEPPPATTAPNPVVVHATPPRDLGAELRAVRAELDSAKTKLTR